MSDTPETDQCVKDNKHLRFLQEDHYVGTDKITYENPIVFLSRKLERERDEAIRSCHIWQKGHAELVAERDKYLEQITYLLDRLGNAERGFLGSNKRLFTSPFTDPQLPVVNSFSGDAMKIIAHKKHE